MAFPTGWNRKQKITINNTKVSGTGSHAYFPLLVTLDHLDAEIVDAGSNSVLNGGGDVRFTSDAAGTTQLPLDVVEFVTNATASSRKCEMWVKVTSVSTSANTDIYIWYNKSAESQPAVTGTYGRNAVWSDYSYVLHLGSVAPASIIDSTGNHVVSIFGSPVNDAGMLKFDGVNDYLSMPDSTLTRQTTLSTLTAVARVRVDYSGDHHYFHAKRGSGAAGQAYRIAGNNPTYTKYGIADYAFGAVTVDTVDKDFYAFTVNGTSAKDFQNGVLKNTITVSSTVGTNTNQVIIGAGQFTSGAVSGPYNLGWTGELRFSNTVERSTNWLTTEYNNQSNPATFATAGTPEAGSGATGDSVAVTAATSTMSAAGTASHTGSGTPQAATATASGAGSFSGINTASGTLQANNVTDSGIGVIKSVANGSISANNSALVSTGSIQHIVSSNITSNAASMTSSGKITIVSIGSMMANINTVSGVGDIKYTGSGSTIANTATVIGRDSTITNTMLGVTRPLITGVVKSLISRV